MAISQQVSAFNLNPNAYGHISNMTLWLYKTKSVYKTKDVQKCMNSDFKRYLLLQTPPKINVE
jgi:hypothetical protein